MAELKASNLGLLLRCYEGLRNWRALAMLAAGYALTVLLLAMNAFIESQLGFEHRYLALGLGIVLLLIAALVLLAAVNGTGLLLVDQADGKPSRGFGAAFFGGIGVTLQAIVCLIALAIGLLVVVLVLFALSFLGKIPGIGALFAFVLAGPTMLILAFCYGVLVFGVTLMFVALWRGHGMLGSIGRAMDIVRRRPLETVLHFIVLALLILPIAVFVALVLAAGASLTSAMYGAGAMLGGDLSYMMHSGAGAEMAAVMVSVAIVVAVVVALFVLIQMLGNILIFDSLSADTEPGAADFLRDKVQQVKAKVEANRPQAPAGAPAAAAAAPPPPRPQPAAPAAARCASCHAQLVPGDRFCGECGTPV